MYHTHHYGPAPDQVGDLYLPAANVTTLLPVMCLLHGGFWRLPYGRDHIAPIAGALTARGFAVWNLEYRRVGTVHGGWPATLQDVGAGIDRLATLAAAGEPLDLGRTMAMGHSAGGHLALWAAGRSVYADMDYQPKRVRIAAVVALAPVADLALAYELDCGNGAVAQFLGGSPPQQPMRYRTTSPVDLLPLRVPQLIVHGTQDHDVPVVIGRRYAAAAAAAGDDVRYVELPRAGHMEFVDPTSEAHAAAMAALDRLTA